MPRRVSAVVPVGQYAAGTRARLWASDNDGNLINSAPFLTVPNLASDQDPRWLDNVWLAVPFLEVRHYARWATFPFLQGNWLQDYRLIEIPGPMYEEGVFEFGVSITDRLGRESTTPPATAKVYVNDSPERIDGTSIAHAAGVVTMTVTSEPLLSHDPLTGFSSGFTAGFR